MCVHACACVHAPSAPHSFTCTPDSPESKDRQAAWPPTWIAPSCAESQYSPDTVSFKKDHSRVVRGLLAELVLAPPDADWIKKAGRMEDASMGDRATISPLSIQPLALCPQSLRCVRRALHGKDEYFIEGWCWGLWGRGLQPQSIREAIGSKEPRPKGSRWRCLTLTCRQRRKYWHFQKKKINVAWEGFLKPTILVLCARHSPVGSECHNALLYK